MENENHVPGQIVDKRQLPKGQLELVAVRSGYSVRLSDGKIIKPAILNEQKEGHIFYGLLSARQAFKGWSAHGVRNDRGHFIKGLKVNKL